MSGIAGFSGLLAALQGWICMVIQAIRDKSILNHVNGCWTIIEFYSRISNVLAFSEKSCLLQIGQTPGISWTVVSASSSSVLAALLYW